MKGEEKENGTKNRGKVTGWVGGGGGGEGSDGKKTRIDWTGKWPSKNNVRR